MAKSPNSLFPQNINNNNNDNPWDVVNKNCTNCGTELFNDQIFYGLCDVCYYFSGNENSSSDDEYSDDECSDDELYFSNDKYSDDI